MSAWSLAEVELVVADYFAMLAVELAQRPYSKTRHREQLRPLLDGRSDGSIEFKHCNISAVLINFAMPYVEGYKPRYNYQQLLERVVLERLSIEPDLVPRLESSPVVAPAAAPPTDFSDIAALMVDPPEVSRAARPMLPPGEPTARRVDFVQRDAENRRLGRLGEEWTVEFEKRRLHDLERRPDLARKVEWVADTRGDGLGFDIASFNTDATPRLIEVKTTGLGKYFPFVVTANEVRVSEREPGAYQLYRVFNFSTDARLYTLAGALSATCRLDATQFRARAGKP